MRVDRLDLVHRGGLELREGWFGFGGRETSCLQMEVSKAPDLLLAVLIEVHTLEHIKTDTTELVDVGMVYLCKESNLWWGHRIVVRKKQLKLEDAAYNLVSAMINVLQSAVSCLRMGTGWDRVSRHRNIEDYPRGEPH